MCMGAEISKVFTGTDKEGKETRDKLKLQLVYNKEVPWVYQTAVV